MIFNFEKKKTFFQKNSEQGNFSAVIHADMGFKIEKFAFSLSNLLESTDILTNTTTPTFAIQS